MRRYLLVLCVLSLCVVSQAQQEKMKVAVLDPTISSVSKDVGLAVQEIISSTFVNTGRYIIIERSMIDKIIKEQSFQNSDLADNSQATEIGRIAGANKVVLSSISMVGSKTVISVKIIDVQTANIDKQQVKTVPNDELLDAVHPLTLSLLGVESNNYSQSQPFSQREMVFKVEGSKKSYNQVRVVNETSIKDLRCRIMILNDDKSEIESYGDYYLKENGDSDSNTKRVNKGTLLGIQFPESFTESVSFFVQYKNYPMFDVIVVHLRN